MGALRRHRGSHWVALVAAYVLLAQALFGALATGAAATALPSDSALGILCLTQGADRAAGDSQPAGQHHLPECCLLGCSMFAPVSLAAPESAGLLRTAARSVVVAFVVDEADPAGPCRRGSPAFPRAPPFEV